MLDLRDAILDGDGIRNPSGDPGGSQNHCRIWDVFALRGMGAAAQDTDDTGTASVVEDFHCPGRVPGAASADDDLGHRNRRDRDGDERDARTVPPRAHRRHVVCAHGLLQREWHSDERGATSRRCRRARRSRQAPRRPISTVTAHRRCRRRGERDRCPHRDRQRRLQGGVQSAATVTIVSDDVAPNLVVTALTVPATASAGSVMAISGTTKNQGTGASSASTTRFYLSANTGIEASDPVVGSSAVGTLAVGASAAASLNVTIPGDTGTRHVFPHRAGRCRKHKRGDLRGQ